MIHRMDVLWSMKNILYTLQTPYLHEEFPAWVADSGIVSLNDFFLNNEKYNSCRLSSTGVLNDSSFH